jgi:RNA polymerase sigma-70 factor (ECF subfamily)
VATVVQREVADRELIERAEQGDREAFGALYRRHFQGLYDFALRIVRDDDLAADVVQSTFVKAWDAARKQKEVGNVKAWLYTIAHNLAIDELRLRKRLAEPPAGGRGDDGGFPFAVVDPSRFSDPEAVVQDRELVELVWDSASALNPQEYALLDLHLRRGLDAEEISRHLSLAKSAVYTRLSRLRDSLEEAVTSTLLMRRGRRECLDLDWLLEELRATEATQPVRRAIKQHLEACERCQESKRRLVSPAEIFAGISLVPLALELQSEIWEGVASHLALGPAAAAANGAGTADATPVDAAANGAGAEVVAPVDAGFSSLLSAKGVAVSALATGAAVVTATTLVFTGGGGGKIEDPDDVHSTTHVVGRSSTENVVRMAWSRVEDADAYSVSWSRGSALPDRTADLDGNATGAKSPRLAPGRWYFNLRTRGDDDWTSTVHVGPFVIAPERELTVTRRVEPRRSPKAKPRLKPKRAVERSTLSSAAYRSPVVDQPPAPDSSPAADSSPVVGVAGVVGKQQPQESDDKTDEKPSPKPPSPQQSSVPVVESTSPPPPPPAEPLSSPPPASADDADEDGDDEREDDEPEQQQPAEQEPAEQQQPEDDERKDEEPPDEKKQKDGEDARGEKKGKGHGERPED